MLWKYFNKVNNVLSKIFISSLLCVCDCVVYMYVFAHMFLSTSSWVQMLKDIRGTGFPDAGVRSQIWLLYKNSIHLVSEPSLQIVENFL